MQMDKIDQEIRGVLYDLIKPIFVGYFSITISQATVFSKSIRDCLENVVRDDAHMAFVRIVQFQDPSPPPVHLRPKFFHPHVLGRPISNETLFYASDNQSFKRIHDPRMALICYQQSSLSLKDRFTVSRQCQKEDFLSIIY